MEVLQFVKNYKLKEATLTGTLFQKFNMAKGKNRKSRGYYSFGPVFFSYSTSMAVTRYCHATTKHHVFMAQVHWLIDFYLFTFKKEKFTGSKSFFKLTAPRDAKKILLCVLFSN